MKSYQIQPAPPPGSDAKAHLLEVADKLRAQGHVIISASFGATLTVRVQPAAATRLLDSVCTGQGWDAGKMYRSYAAIVDGVQVAWRKPMRAPETSNVIRWPGQGYRRAVRKCTA
jgi:hypothetical protein